MSEEVPVESLLAEGGERVSDHLELLAVMGRDFAESMDIDETLRRALKRITRYMDAEGSALFLLDDDGAILRCTACVGPVDLTGLRLPGNHGIVGRSVQHNAGEIVRDVSTDPSFNNTVDAKTGFTTRSILCAPISVHDQRIGAIELVNKLGGDGLFARSDLQLLQVLATSAALAILNARMAAALVEQERVRREMELAAEIQKSLLPEARDAAFPIHGINVPLRAVSGDFYDFFDLPDGRICFNLADVSGKGMNAALLMAKTCSLFRCLGKTVNEPGRLLAAINAEVCETATMGMFVTLVGGVYDPASGVVRLANAGHEPVLVRRRDGTWESFAAEAPPLGISPLLVGSADFPETEVRLDGGTMYVFTDGVTEGSVGDGRPFGADGLKAEIEAHLDRTAADRLAHVIDRLAGGAGDRHDDLTILAVDDGGAQAIRAAT